MLLRDPIGVPLGSFGNGGWGLPPDHLRCSVLLICPDLQLCPGVNQASHLCLLCPVPEPRALHILCSVPSTCTPAGVFSHHCHLEMRTLRQQIK